MITIREYAESDRPTLVRFMEELQDYLIPLDPLKRLNHPEGYGEAYTGQLLEKLEKGNGIVYFAEVEGHVVGCVAGLVEAVPAEGFVGTVAAKKGVIEELYVDAAYRAKGIGSALLDAIETYFKKHTCDYVHVDVFEPNPARSFYEKHGYGDRLRKMHKELK